MNITGRKPIEHMRDAAHVELNYRDRDIRPYIYELKYREAKAILSGDQQDEFPNMLRSEAEALGISEEELALKVINKYHEWREKLYVDEMQRRHDRERVRTATQPHHITTPEQPR